MRYHPIKQHIFVHSSFALFKASLLCFAGTTLSWAISERSKEHKNHSKSVNYQKFRSFIMSIFQNNFSKCFCFFMAHRFLSLDHVCFMIVEALAFIGSQLETLPVVDEPPRHRAGEKRNEIWNRNGEKYGNCSDSDILLLLINFSMKPH